MFDQYWWNSTLIVAASIYQLGRKIQYYLSICLGTYDIILHVKLNNYPVNNVEKVKGYSSSAVRRVDILRSDTVLSTAGPTKQDI